MSAYCIFISRRAEIAEAVQRFGDQAVPDEQRRNYRGGLHVSQYWISGPNPTDALCTFFLKKVDKADAILAFWDETAASEADIFDGILLSRSVCGYELLSSPHNYMQRYLSRTLRDLNFLRQKHSAFHYQQALLLPRRNYVYKHRKDLDGLFSLNYLNNSFIPDFEQQLKLLAENKVPKRKGRGKGSFFRSEDGRFFKMGLEQHGEAEVKPPEHNLLCQLSKHFRYGLSYETSRHFNVSLENGSRFGGGFPNCHGSQTQKTNVRHLNVFPNDFIR